MKITQFKSSGEFAERHLINISLPILLWITKIHRKNNPLTYMLLKCTYDYTYMRGKRANSMVKISNKI